MRLGKNERNYSQSDFYCTECGQKGIPIMRFGNQFREPGHLKKLYCIHCGHETNHCEIRPFGTYLYEDFKEELDLGRFIDGKRIPIHECEKCEVLDCPYNRAGRCWNCNKTYQCEKRSLDK